jgi:hypothetical protein
MSADEFFIQQAVDREHVGTPYRRVLRRVISNLRGSYETYRGYSRAKRRRLMKFVAKAHTQNRKLYSDVMGPGYLDAWDLLKSRFGD